MDVQHNATRTAGYCRCSPGRRIISPDGPAQNDLTLGRPDDHRLMSFDTLQSAGVTIHHCGYGRRRRPGRNRPGRLPGQHGFQPKLFERRHAFLDPGRPGSHPENIQAALVVLGDQPQIEESTVREMLELYQREKPAVIVPSYHMRRGHPWLIEKKLWPDIQNMAPPATMREFFQQHSQIIRYLEVDTASVLSDLDTPEDYAKNKPAPQG